MASWLALDLSLSSTGFAYWRGDDRAPVIGHWRLADHIKWRAGGYVQLHKRMMELHRETPIDYIAAEEPLTQSQLQGRSNIQTIELQVGLAAHVQSFAAAVKAVPREIHQSTWRRHFIGVIPRGTKSHDLKAMAMKRAKELGFDPANNDESDAIGILDYFVSINDVLPPWRKDFCLERQLDPLLDGKRAKS